MFKHSQEKYDNLFQQLKTDNNQVEQSTISEVLTYFNSPMNLSFVNELFQLVDLDNNNLLSQSEFMKFCYIIENSFKQRDTPRSLFCFADSDFSGGINSDEFVWIMHKIVGKFDDFEMKSAFTSTVQTENMDFETFVLLMREFT